MRRISKIRFIACSAALVAAVLWSGPAGAVPAAQDITGIHMLGNGLEARLYERPDTSLFSALVLVKTGYAYEAASRRGYSHLLEHLVFAGTSSRTKKMIMKDVERAGGYINGFTRADYTGYIVVGHKSRFNELMDLLSDMLFRSILEKAALEEAREVVLEEVLRDRSRPTARIDGLFQRLLYTGTPYAYSGLGSEQSITSATVGQIQTYYHDTYRPDNMVLLVAGGLHEKKMLEVLNGTFGKARPGSARQVSIGIPVITGSRVGTLRAEVPDVQVKVGFAGPDSRDNDVEALELLSQVLGGSGGLMEKALSTAGMKPRSVDVFLRLNHGFSRFVVSVDLPAETDPGAALEVVLTALEGIGRKGISQEEVNRTRDAMVFSEMVGREKIHYFLMEKAPWVISGSPGQGFSAGRWDHLGPEDLDEVVRSYLVGSPYTSLLVVPSNRAVNVQDTGKVSFGRRVLDNGLTVLAEQRPGSQVFALHLMTRQRSELEPEGKAGIVDFMHRMLPRGTDERSHDQIEDDLRRLGASLETTGDPMSPFGDFYTSRTYSFLKMQSLIDRSDAASTLAAEMVTSPSFPEAEVEEVRGRMLDLVSYMDLKPSSVASRLLAGRLYDGVLAPDVLGRAETIKSITRQDLQDFHKSYFTGRNLILSIVSGLPVDEAFAIAEAYFASIPEGPPITVKQIPLTREPETIRSKLGKPQGAIAVGAVTGKVDDKSLPALAVGSAILGRRMSASLREREGLAYSVGSSISVVGDRAVFLLSMGTAPDKIERARKSIRRELEVISRSPVSAEEIEMVVSSAVGRVQMRMLSSINRAYYLALAEKKGLSHQFGEKYRDALLRVTPADVRSVLSAYLPGKNVVTAIVR